MKNSFVLFKSFRWKITAILVVLMCLSGAAGNILIMRPSDCAKQNANLIEIMNIVKLLKNAVVKVGFQVENAFTSIFYLNIYSEVWQWLDGYYIPVHGNLIVE